MGSFPRTAWLSLKTNLAAPQTRPHTAYHLPGRAPSSEPGIPATHLSHTTLQQHGSRQPMWGQPESPFMDKPTKCGLSVTGVSFSPRQKRNPIPATSLETSHSSQTCSPCCMTARSRASRTGIRGDREWAVLAGGGLLPPGRCQGLEQTCRRVCL